MGAGRSLDGKEHRPPQVSTRESWSSRLSMKAISLPSSVSSIELIWRRSWLGTRLHLAHNLSLQ